MRSVPLRETISALGLGLLLLACATSGPDLLPVSHPEFEESEREREIKQAAREYAEALERSELVFEDEELRAYLQGHVDTLLGSEGLEPGRVEIVLIKNSFLNTSMLAHGVMNVHVGMVSQIQNEAQLLTLFGHELAHYLERHALAAEIFEDRETSRAMWTRVFAGVLLAPTGLSPLVFVDIERKGMKGVIAPQLGGYSRELETDADQYAYQTLLRQGYPTEEAARFFQLMIDDTEQSRAEKNMREDSGVDDPYFYASHPDLVDRRAHMRALEEERLAVCRNPARSPDSTTPACAPSPRHVGEQAYMARIELAVLENARLDRRIGRHLRATRSLERMLAFHPESATGWVMLGQIRGGRGARPETIPSAIEALERAVEIDPSLADAHRELGFLYSRANRTPESRHAFRRFLELEPDAKDRRLIELEFGLTAHSKASPDDPGREAVEAPPARESETTPQTDSPPSEDPP